MSFKKGFTLLEVLFSIIIISLVGVVVSNIIFDTSKRYMIDYNYRLLDMQTTNYISKLKNLFNNIVINTLIADKCNYENDDCYNGNYTDFKSLSSLPSAGTDTDYPVIEFMKENNYINYYVWNDNKNQNIALTSKFVDLKDTKTINASNNEYNITVVYSNMNLVFNILKKELEDYGITEEPSKDSNTVLLMSGPYNKGDILDINNSYGYKKNNAYKLFSILDYTTDNNPDPYNKKDFLRIKPINNLNGIVSEPYQTFFIINSAYALVPKKNDKGLIDIYLYKYYKPWKKELYKDAKVKELFMKNLSKWEIKEVSGSIYIYLCKKFPDSDKLEPKLSSTLEVCKEYFKY